MKFSIENSVEFVKTVEKPWLWGIEYLCLYVYYMFILLNNNQNIMLYLLWCMYVCVWCARNDSQNHNMPWPITSYNCDYHCLFSLFWLLFFRIFNFASILHIIRKKRTSIYRIVCDLLWFRLSFGKAPI